MEEGGSIRFRTQKAEIPFVNRFSPMYSTESSGGHSKAPRITFPWSTTLGILLFAYLAAFFITQKLDNSLPEPVLIRDAKHGQFVAERAWGHLMRILGVGPRPTGSYANEVLTVDLLVRELNFIKQMARKTHNVEVDIQRTSGSFTLKETEPATSVYDNIVNVVVRFSSKDNTTTKPGAWLINGHFDSVFQGPGASDNAVNVAVMLEILEVLAKQNTPIKHPIIFLFNGAEENRLQGSHAFITQHHWAPEVKAFVNLDSCGAGGREIVFQSGPGNPWLIKAYASSALHPFAHSAAQDIFDAKLIPSDTDFRIFRDFGKLPGLDLALFKNGYVYHTSHDSIAHLTTSTVQRLGDNLLALTLHVANGDYLETAEAADKASGRVVYFDFLGWFVITLGGSSWFLLNAVTLGLTGWQASCWFRQMERHGFKRDDITKQLVLAVMSIGLAWIAALIACLGAVAVGTLLGCTMTWFARPYWILGLYVCPALSAAIYVYKSFSANYHSKVFDNAFFIERLQTEACKLFFAFFIILTFLFGVRSNIILLQFVLFPALGRVASDRFHSGRLDKNALAFHGVSLIIPILLNFYVSNSLFTCLIPTTGRSGSMKNPDVTIAILTWFIAMLLTSYTIPVANFLRRPNKLISALLALYCLSLAIVFITPMGFPFSGSAGLLAPQRLHVSHVERKIHDRAGVVQLQESGYWFDTPDYLSPHTLLKYSTAGSDIRYRDELCSKEPYCGMPFFFPSLSRTKHIMWMPAAKPNVYHPVKLNLESQKPVGIRVRRLTFQISGPDHMAVMVWPYRGIQLAGWSLTAEPAPINVDPLRPVYFVFYSYGKEVTSWEFHIDLRIPSTYDTTQPIVDLAVTSHFLHGVEQHSPEFAAFLDKFPDWMSVYGQTSTYALWTF